MKAKYTRCPSQLGYNDNGSINNAYGLMSTRTEYWGTTGLFTGSAGNNAWFIMKNIGPKHIMLSDSGVYSSTTGKINDFSIFKPTDSGVSSRGKFWMKHNGRCNVAFGDGHVKIVSPGEAAVDMRGHLLAAKAIESGTQVSTYYYLKHGTQKVVKIK